MKITAIPVDNFIIKDGVEYFTSNDDTFWNSYSTVHALQIGNQLKMKLLL